MCLYVAANAYVFPGCKANFLSSTIKLKLNAMVLSCIVNRRHFTVKLVPHYSKKVFVYAHFESEIE